MSPRTPSAPIPLPRHHPQTFLRPSPPHLVRLSSVSADASDPLGFSTDGAAAVGTVHLQHQRTGQLRTALALAHAGRALARAPCARVQCEVLTGGELSLAHHAARVGLDAPRACRGQKRRVAASVDGERRVAAKKTGGGGLQQSRRGAEGCRVSRREAEGCSKVDGEWRVAAPVDGERRVAASVDRNGRLQRQ